MAFLSRRHRHHELMDAPDADPQNLDRSLHFIHRINRVLRYTQSTINHLESFSKNWTPGQPIRILDLATGSADVPRAILKWADAKNHNLQIVAVDFHTHTIQHARNVSPPDPRLSLLQADVFALPFEPASFDYVISSMFFHHLDDPQVVSLLKIMDQLAIKGLIVADLLRHFRAYFWVTLMTLFSNPMVRHDARVSVAQAYRKAEIIGLARQAGLTYLAYTRHPAHRFVLAGEKSSR